MTDNIQDSATNLKEAVWTSQKLVKQNGESQTQPCTTIHARDRRVNPYVSLVIESGN